jgi:hypothetical protein
MTQKVSRTQKLLLPRLQDILFIAIFISVIGFGARTFNIDGDLGRHLTIGEYILQTLSIPREDIFSHSMFGERLTPHEWLSQVILALAFKFAGLDGVVILCAFLIALTFTLLFRLCYKRSGLLLVSFGWTILAAAAASLHWLARPHLFTLIMVVLWTGALDRFRRKEHHRWWVFPLLMLLWANLHGAFIAGFVIWGMFFIGELWDKYARKRHEVIAKDWISSWLLIGVTSIISSLINPAGWRLWETSFGFIRNRYLVGHTAEYLPPNFHDPSTWPFLIMIGLSIVIFARSRYGLPGAYALLTSGWTLMGLYSLRNIPIYSLAVTPIFAELFARQLRESKGLSNFSNYEERLSVLDRSLRGYMIPSMIVILMFFGLISGINLDFDGTGNRFSPDIFPVVALDSQQNQLPDGNMFNYFPWGGYLLYRIWPAQRVFIDGQTDFYGEALTREYEKVITLQEGWQGVFDRYDVEWVIFPSDSRLVEYLLSDSGWQIYHLDEVAAILTRSSTD